jgi:hypothetical protein
MAQMANGTKLIACTVVQAMHQPRFVPSRATPSGVINWNTAPTSTGTLAIIPAATGPRPSARAKAGM